MAATLQEHKARWESSEGLARIVDEIARAAALGPLTDDRSAAWAASVAADKRALADYRKRRSVHPLAGVLDGLGPDALTSSEEPRRRIKRRDLGNGHVEMLTYMHKPNLQRQLERAIDWDVGKPPASVRGEGDVQGNAESNGRRAKRDVRLYCKLLGVSSLWTLTYRGNQRDRVLARKHLTAFVRRVRAVLPGFRYLAVSERQKRGAIHWHIATHGLPPFFVVKGHKVKSWNLMRSIWRSVVGDWGGNFDESKGVRKWKREGRVVRAGAIGRYISKYLAKGFEETDLNAHRFSRSMDATLPPAERIDISGDMCMREVIELCFAGVGSGVTGTRFDAESGVFFIESDDSALIGSGPS